MRVRDAAVGACQVARLILGMLLLLAVTLPARSARPQPLKAPLGAPRAQPVVTLGAGVVAGPPLGTACLVYDEATSGDGPLQHVRVSVRNACADTLQVSARVDLVIEVLGSGHSWVADTAELEGSAPAVVEGNFSNGIVGQRPCVRLRGTALVTGSTALLPVDVYRCW